VAEKMSAVADSAYVLTYSKGFPLDMGRHALARMIQICDDTGAGMVYADYYEKKNDVMSPHPVIDYHEGSLRDDFNFGSVILYEANAFRDACSRMDTEYSFAGLYDLRLKISQKYPCPHSGSSLTELDCTRRSGRNSLTMLIPNRAVQIEGKALHPSPEVHRRMAPPRFRD